MTRNDKPSPLHASNQECLEIPNEELPANGVAQAHRQSAAEDADETPQCALGDEASAKSVDNSIDTVKPIVADLRVTNEIRDPSKALIEIAPDSVMPLAPDASEIMTRPIVDDRKVFKFQVQIKKPDCQELAAARDEDSADVPRRNLTQADILVRLAESAELFRTPDGTSFADIDINGHRETWAIRSKRFRNWLGRLFYQATQGAAGSEALQAALNVLESRAHFDAEERAVYVRVAGIDGRLYLDLCDKTWRAVEIDATGWRVIDRPPVRFRRAAGMLSLPAPVKGGSLDALRPFVNVKSDADFVLVVAWALAVLRNRGPYPLLALSGEQGSAKSTLVAALRALLDPNTADLRALPREERDLFISAMNAHLLAFDNVSGLSPWISDGLCRLATGGGFVTRQLRTDQDEVLFTAARPIILNGIEEIVTRPDLADRSVFLTLEPISDNRRRSEEEFWTVFEAERPRILGLLLDAVAHGLKRLPETRLNALPRMADFAMWVTACETALWPAGTFAQAYAANLATAVEDVIEADLVAGAVRDLMARELAWAGTATDLLGVLKAVAGEHYIKSKLKPESPRALSGKLRRAATFLRKVGIDITFDREGRARTRIIHIVKRT